MIWRGYSFVYGDKRENWMMEKIEAAHDGRQLGKIKDKVFTVNLHHDEIFISNPIKYVQGELKQIIDINFEGMSFNDLRETARHLKLVLGTVKRLYYCSIKSELNVGIKELKTDNDVEDFLRVGYENKWFMNLYVEYFDYDVLDFLNDEGNVNETPYESSNEYYSSDEIEEFDYVDFHIEGEENVVINNLTTKDPFLNKFCSNHGSFRGFIDEPVPVDQEPIEDSDDANIDPMNVEAGRLVKKGKPVRKGRVVVEMLKNHHSHQSGQKGMKDGWLEGCRRVTGLDGCFLKQTCRGELLTGMGRDANNQMYLIAWVVVRVENRDNWCSGLSLISDGHKGLHDAVRDWLPNAEHKKCTRHIYTNFKKKFNGLKLQKLFWHAASCIVPQLFYFKMEKMKQINSKAHEYLIGRNPNSWSRAFFNVNVKCPTHKGVSDAKGSSHAQYSCEFRRSDHTNCQKEVRVPKKGTKTIFPSAYQELEVKCGDSSFGVNLTKKRCACRAYQHSIKLVLRTKMWKRTDNHPPLPPIMRKMSRRPIKERIKALGENSSQVSMVMRCSNCPGIGYNKARCDKEPVPKAPMQRKSLGRTRQYVFGTHSSAIGHGRGSRGGRGTVDGRNGSANRGPQLMDEDEIRVSLEHNYMQDLWMQRRKRRNMKRGNINKG
ncbi:splicing factor [Tanacetum coccineum]